jgi:hypothetical protein
MKLEKSLIKREIESLGKFNQEMIEEVTSKLMDGKTELRTFRSFTEQPIVLRFFGMVLAFLDQ